MIRRVACWRASTQQAAVLELKVRLHTQCCWKNAPCCCWRQHAPRAVWLEADPDSLTAAGEPAGKMLKHLEGCTAALLLAVRLAPVCTPRSAGLVR